MIYHKSRSSEQAPIHAEMREAKRIWLLGIILPTAYILPAATAFHNCPRLVLPNAPKIHLQLFDKRPRLATIFSFDNDPTSTTNTFPDPLFASDNGDDADTTSKAAIYKDDSFGFTTFVAGIAVQDYLFTGIFVTLSLFGDIFTRIGILPPDPKRPYIVDRRVPGVVGILTLFLRYTIAESVVDVPSLLPGDMDAELARTLQYAFCIFSCVTAFLDIRWRDQFDYPDDPV